MEYGLSPHAPYVTGQGQRKGGCAEYGDTCHSVHEDKGGGRVGPGLEPVPVVADGAFLLLVSVISVTSHPKAATLHV